MSLIRAAGASVNLPCWQAAPAATLTGMFGLPRIHHRSRNVRLDTLVRLRWLAVFGQFAAVLVVHFGLEFDVRVWASRKPSGSSPTAPLIYWPSTSPNWRRYFISLEAWRIRSPFFCSARC